jgi:hypothetical protein
MNAIPAGPGIFQNRREAERTTPHDVSEYGSQGASPSPSSDGHFERILDRVLEAPSNCSYMNLLSKEEFFHNGSTFLHFVAAKGRISDVLTEVIRFTFGNGHSIDEVDEEGYTAFHVAVKNDRCDNAHALSCSGASPFIRNKMGELPLHTCILTSESGLLFVQILHYHSAGLKASVNPPSAQAGQIALDLVVNRVMNELSKPDTFLCCPATKHILGEVLKRLPMVDDNSRFLLRERAIKDPDRFSRVEYVVRRLSPGHELRKIMAQIMVDRGISARQTPCPQRG